MRELAFRTLCRHRQGDKPNILLFCNRRGGSTWLLNTLAASPGCRYVGRPFLSAVASRHRGDLPPSMRPGVPPRDRAAEHLVELPDAERAAFRSFAEQVLAGQREVYPAVHPRAPYFQRRTDRIIFQMTTGGAMAEWFGAQFPVATLVLIRHPISNALSIRAQGWKPNVEPFLAAERFVDEHLTGPQVDLLRGLVDGGDPVPLLVAECALHLLVPLRAIRAGRQPTWLGVHYEQLVRDTDGVLSTIAAHFDLSGLEAMRQVAARPSRTVATSTRGRVDDPGYLLGRWRREVPPGRERELMAICDALAADAYAVGADDPVAPLSGPGSAVPPAR